MAHLCPNSSTCRSLRTDNSTCRLPPQEHECVLFSLSAKFHTWCTCVRAGRPRARTVHKPDNAIAHVRPPPSLITASTHTDLHEYPRCSQQQLPPVTAVEEKKKGNQKTKQKRKRDHCAFVELIDATITGCIGTSCATRTSYFTFLTCFVTPGVD